MWVLFHPSSNCVPDGDREGLWRAARRCRAGTAAQAPRVALLQLHAAGSARAPPCCRGTSRRRVVRIETVCLLSPALARELMCSKPASWQLLLFPLGSLVKKASISPVLCASLQYQTPPAEPPALALRLGWACGDRRLRAM